MKPSHIAIAIDGPAASGKSTIARLLAEKLGLVMVNSGAMYRAFTYHVIANAIMPTDTAAVIDLLNAADISCGHSHGFSTIAINGYQPSEEDLRSEAVNANVSTVAAIPEVRTTFTNLQRAYLNHSHVVMEGRDIGSVVFPNTPYKIYVSANEEVRSARRAKMGEIDSIAQRDAADSKRTAAPLVIADGATVLDNSYLNIPESVDAALKILTQQGLSLSAL